MKTYAKIAHLLNAMGNCEKAGNTEWLGRHEENILELVKDGPSGSGIDCGTKIDLDRGTGSTEDCLKFAVSYHHMNDGGYYDGWTEHVLTVKPSLAFGFTMSFSGRDRNDIKEYLHDVYSAWLDSEVAETVAA